MKRWIPLIVGVALTAASIGGILALGAAGWPGEADDCIAAAACFCEEFTEGVIVAQPWNTWSNLAFVVAGLSLLVAAGIDQGKWEVRDPTEAPNPWVTGGFYPSFFGVIVMLMGPGSMVFHAGLRQWGSIVDNLSMLMLTGFVILFNVGVLVPALRKKGVFVATYVGVVGGLIAIEFATKGAQAVTLTIFAVTLLGAVGTEIALWFNKGKLARVMRNPAAAVFALSTFVMVFVIWILSRDGGPICDPDGFQGHAIWHLGTAVASGVWGHYLRSENNLPDHLDLPLPYEDG